MGLDSGYIVSLLILLIAYGATWASYEYHWFAMAALAASLFSAVLYHMMSQMNPEPHAVIALILGEPLLGEPQDSEIWGNMLGEEPLLPASPVPHPVWSSMLDYVWTSAILLLIVAAIGAVFERQITQVVTGLIQRRMATRCRNERITIYLPSAPPSVGLVPRKDDVRRWSLLPWRRS